MPELNAYARERLAELHASNAHPLVIGHVGQLLAEGDDFAVFKVNAFRVAEEVKVPRGEALRGFLYATKLGLFDLAYDLHCPSCKGIPELHKRLAKLALRSRCDACEAGFDVDFEKHVEVTFTVNPAVRPVTYADFQKRPQVDQGEFYGKLNQRERRSFAAAELLVPGQRTNVEVALQPGEYQLYLPTGQGAMDRGCRLSVQGALEPGAQRLDLYFDERSAASPGKAELRPGRVTFSAVGRQARADTFFVRLIHEETNWVSAAHVCLQQDFRDLFSGEFLAPDINFAVRSVTLMFTDLKSSTELYEELGDAKAYALVQEHFRILTEAIRRHEGGIVKTIGDAVMASFPDNLSAVRAAVEIQRELGRAGGELKRLQVKIGLHRGPTIAVTSNRSLDFFGRTVNVAARVQNESRAGEVVLSKGVTADPRVPAFLAEQKLLPSERLVNLKGIAGSVAISCFTP
jgi:adenylate cyclase